MLALCILPGCATTKGNVQDFVSCLEVGMPLQQVKDACASRLEKPALFLEGYLTRYKDIAAACLEPTVLCSPINLTQLLHSHTSPPFTEDDPGVVEPNYMVKVDSIPIFGSLPYVKVFYDQTTDRVIGWVAYGL